MVNRGLHPHLLADPTALHGLKQEPSSYAPANNPFSITRLLPGVASTAAAAASPGAQVPPDSKPPELKQMYELHHQGYVNAAAAAAAASYQQHANGMHHQMSSTGGGGGGGIGQPSDYYQSPLYHPVAGSGPVGPGSSGGPGL
ncbi:homeobox even-skipped homolog protein 2-like [Copidosoma floridanum]|nr:homeobox even-skipped homolog protein 2-like [Copidosoma floridanum]